MLSFEIGQRKSGFYCERTDRQIDRQTQSPSHPVAYYNIDSTDLNIKVKGKYTKKRIAP